MEHDHGKDETCYEDKMTPKEARDEEINLVGRQAIRIDELETNVKDLEFQVETLKKSEKSKDNYIRELEGEVSKNVDVVRLQSIIHKFKETVHDAGHYQGKIRDATSEITDFANNIMSMAEEAETGIDDLVTDLQTVVTDADEDEDDDDE